VDAFGWRDTAMSVIVVSGGLDMKTNVKSYSSPEIEVRYDAARCIHAAECVRGLRAVFDPDRKPWIDPNQADAERIAQVIERCPSGALKYVFKDGRRTEAAPTACRVTVAVDGPLYARGELKVLTPDGQVLLEDTRIALCRCGQSGNKPLCDGSHERSGFKDTARVRPPPQAMAAASTGGPVTVQPRRDGPYLFQGSFVLAGAGGELYPVCAVALCRCGHSANKPYCDGSHKRVGFKSD
jgi:CDGSH-type Zn-finger protein/uncharacterized Fe-S cluster protein YjdI